MHLSVHSDVPQLFAEWTELSHSRSFLPLLIKTLVEKISILGRWVGEGKGEEFATKVPAVKIFKMCVGRLTFNT